MIASPASPSAAIQGKPSKLELDHPQKIPDWGYSIRTIKGWNSIPADQDDKFVVGRWKPDLETYRMRGDYDGFKSGQYCELTIVRVPIVTKTGEETPVPVAEEEPPKDPQKQPAKKDPRLVALEKRLNPKTLDEFIEARYEGASKRWASKALKGSKVPGHLLEFGSGAESIAIGLFTEPGAEWAVVYTAFEESYRKTWQETYLKSILSFTLFEPTNKDIIANANADGKELKGEAKRAAIKASIAGNPGWYAVDTPSYVFLSNSENKGFIQSLAKEVQLIREKVYTEVFPPQNKEESISPVRVLDSQMEYYQYGGPGGSAGYFNSGSGELVLFTKFMNASKADSAASCRAVAYHEAFHQYVHYAIGDVSPHSWFNEGHGDYFAGIEIKGSRIRYTPFDWRVSFLKEHLRTDRDLIPIRTLIRLPQSEYYTNGGLKYSQGWALVYFLRNVTKNKRYQECLDTYFKHVVDNVAAFKKKKETQPDEPEGETVPGIPGLMIVDFEEAEKVEKILSEAVDKAFEGIDLERMDEEYRSWLKQL